MEIVGSSVLFPGQMVLWGIFTEQLETWIAGVHVFIVFVGTCWHYNSLAQIQQSTWSSQQDSRKSVQLQLLSD